MTGLFLSLFRPLFFFALRSILTHMEEIASTVSTSFGSFVVIAALVFMALVFAAILPLLLDGLFGE